MRIVWYYDRIVDAHTDREYLAGEGIPAEVFNQLAPAFIPVSNNNISMRPYLGVPDEFFDRACELLGVEPAQEVCPLCGSAEIEPYNRDRQDTLRRLLWALSGAGLSAPRSEFKCRSCHKRFKQ